MRLIGCCKDNMEDVLIRFVPSTAAPTQHPLHHHILTFLTGDELDITTSVPVSDDRPTQRQRLQADAAVMSADSDRIFSIAPWLNADDENHYTSINWFTPTAEISITTTMPSTAFQPALFPRELSNKSLTYVLVLTNSWAGPVQYLRTLDANLLIPGILVE